MKTVVDNGNGTTTTVALQDGNLVTGTTSHVAYDILDDAKARHNAGEFGSPDMRHAARVDPVMIERYLNARGITFHEFCKSQDHMRAFLMDRDISGFRIWAGRV